MPEMPDPQTSSSAPPPAPPTLLDQHVAIESSRTECSLQHLWWAAASTLGAACGRSVWTRLMGPSGPRLYPNLYVVLVGEPGGGKTLAVRTASARFAAMKIHTGADSITGAKLLSWAAIASAKRIGEGRDPGLTMALEQLDSLFTRKADPQLKAFLCAAYDCKEEYIQDTQVRGKEPIRKLCLNLIAAATPSHLASCFQPSDWSEGLASRFLLVMGGPSRLEGLPPFDPTLEADYLGRLGTLRSNLHAGLELNWTDEAWTSRLLWRRSQNTSLPPHPHATGYWHNRHTLAVKLAMLLTVSASESTISTATWEEALEALAILESGLPAALAHTGGNPYAGIISAIVRWAYAEGRPVEEWEVRQKLSDFIAPQYIQATIDSILASHQLVESPLNAGAPQTSPNRRMVHPRLRASAANLWQLVKVKK
jgi:hypothetical protein